MRILLTLILLKITFYAQAGTVILESYDALYDPTLSRNLNCDDVVLGERSDELHYLEPDGSSKVRINIEKYDSSRAPNFFVFYSKKKAFLDYFNNDAVVYYDRPQLVKQSNLAKSLLPSFLESSSQWGLINRTGYMKFINDQKEIEDSLIYTSHSFLALGGYNPNPKPDEVVSILRRELIISQDEIILRAKRGFNRDNREIPEHMRNGRYYEDRQCVFMRIK